MYNIYCNNLIITYSMALFVNIDSVGNHQETRDEVNTIEVRGRYEKVECLQ